MKKYDLSILIPSRNEMFLAKTVENLLENKRGNTEVIVGLDGEWSDPVLQDHPDLTVFYSPVSIGQRAMTNQLARLSQAKYVMKIDAHCSVDEGFDVKMIENMQDHYTMVPIMYNLHAFDWVCSDCLYRKYQGPTPDKCEKCGGKMKRDIIWRAKPSPTSTSFMFDTTLHFQYWGSYKKEQKKQGQIVDTLSLQGSCFMLTRKKYWDLNICDEEFGSWGQQGVEVAVKTWLSGGEVKCNMNTWYAHMFRTQGGDFSFPYKQSGRQIDHARKYSRDLFFNNKWDGQIYPFSWLLEKFKPVPEWHEDKGKKLLEDIKKKGEEFYKRKGILTTAGLNEIYDKVTQLEEPKVPVTINETNKEVLYVGTEPKKEIIYYTDNRLNLKIAHKVQKNLLKMEIPIISVSLKPMTFGRNIHLPLERGYLTQAKQILAGLEASSADLIYFCEHDVLYHYTHFSYVPETKHGYFYNTNVWRVRAEDGHALWCDNLQQLSGLVAYRKTLLEHYRKRVKKLEDYIENNITWAWAGTDYEHKSKITQEQFNRYARAMGFEPGTHGRPERVDDIPAFSFMSEYPNIDIRHDNNFTSSRWKKEQFRNKRYTEGWRESHISKLPGWDLSSL